MLHSFLSLLFSLHFSDISLAFPMSLFSCLCSFLSLVSLSCKFVCFTGAHDTKSEFKCSLKPLFLFLDSHLFMGEVAQRYRITRNAKNYFSYVNKTRKILNYIQLQIFQAFTFSVSKQLNFHSPFLSVLTEHIYYAFTLARYKVTRMEQ